MDQNESSNLLVAVEIVATVALLFFAVFFRREKEDASFRFMRLYCASQAIAIVSIALGQLLPGQSWFFNIACVLAMLLSVATLAQWIRLSAKGNKSPLIRRLDRARSYIADEPW